MDSNAVDGRKEESVTCFYSGSRQQKEQAQSGKLNRWTKDLIKYGLNQRGDEPQVKRGRETGERTEQTGWKTTGNTAGKTKERHCRCGGKIRWTGSGGKQMGNGATDSTELTRVGFEFIIRYCLPQSALIIANYSNVSFHTFELFCLFFVQQAIFCLLYFFLKTLVL